VLVDQLASNISKFVGQRVRYRSNPLTELYEFFATNLYQGFGTFLGIGTPDNDGHAAVVYNYCGRLVVYDLQEGTQETMIEWLAKLPAVYTEYDAFIYDYAYTKAQHRYRSNFLLSQLKGPAAHSSLFYNAIGKGKRTRHRKTTLRKRRTTKKRDRGV